jgi:energy-converting hydrogenase Eha subunit H
MSFKFNITNEKKLFHITLGTTVYYNTELRLTNLAAATAHNAFLVVKKTGSQFEAQLSLGQKKSSSCSLRNLYITNAFGAFSA